MSIAAVINHFAVFSILNLLLYQVIKNVKCLSANFQRSVNLQDALIISAITAVVFTLFLLPNPINLVLMFLVISLVGILIWADAILFSVYSTEINWHAAKIFFSGVGGFAGEYEELLRYLYSKPRLLIFPFVFIAFYASIIFSSNTILIATTSSLLLTYLIFCITKSKLNNKTVALWALCFALFFVAMNFSYHQTSQIVQASFLADLVIIAMLSLMTLLVLKQRTNIAFVQQPSLLKNFFLVNPHIQLQDDFLVKPEHQDWIVPAAYQQCKSAQHAIAADANIVLITLESVGSEFIEGYQSEGARLAVLDDLKQTGVFSEHHFSISPNTNNVMQNIYSAQYSNQQSFYWLPQLQQQGYQTLFYTSQNTEHFHLNQHLKDIGFNHVIDRNDFAQQDGFNDYQLVEQLEQRLPQLKQQKFFLHILNNQTHVPYEVVNQDEFKRFNNANRVERYKNSIEEANLVVEQILEKLEQMGLMQNTIVIVTGDHGQAFGEYGYKVHSNAIINAEVKVPFVLHHPQLNPSVISRSSHFDVMPTIFDLCGIHYEHTSCGQSMLAQSEGNLPLLLYSETKKGNFPANFGIVTQKEKIMFDLVYERYYRMSLQDELLEELTGDDKGYWQQLLLRMLQARGLV